MKFEVDALSADNVLSRLSVEAVDEAQARDQVAKRGWVVGRVRVASTSPWASWASLRQSGQRFSVLLFSQELLALLQAGLSLVEALEALLEKEAQASTRTVLGQLLGGLREGKRFSTALAEQPGVFTPLYVGMVQTAEGTSDLPRTLTRIIEYNERVAALKNKIVSAAIYPCILLGVGTLVTGFLVGFVVPRFAEVYQGTGRSLPWMSQLMLDLGHFVAANATAVALAAALTLAALLLALRQALQSRGVSGLLAMLPGIGERMRIYELSRLYLSLSMLMEGGIAVVQAMQTVDAVVSPRLRSALRASQALIEGGSPLSQAFEAQQLTTSVSLRMLRVGERTGNLSSLLMQSATFYDGEMARWIDRFTRSFEPLLMAVIGLVVGLIVVMLYMPIFDLAGNM